MTPQAFVDKWRDMALKERSASQSHFNDLCRLLGKPSPTDADKTGTWYTFERGADKDTGRAGWADVWKRDCFAWEYKGPKKDLRAAFVQLQQYRESLENPPLLIVSDMAVIEVHTNFTNSVKSRYVFTIDDLLDPKKRDLLAKAFDEPEAFRVAITPDDVTREAAAKFARLAEILRDQGEDPQRAAHFLIRLLFCLFAEDAGLLPNNAFTKLVEATKATPAQFTLGMRQLFGAMSTGGLFGFEKIPYFDGGLFENEDAVPLSPLGLKVLSEVAGLDWSSIEPAIFGTLFERSLDPAKRSQLGAHYTSREDILLIVEPVLMAPLRRRWAEVRSQAEALVVRRDAAAGAGARSKIEGEIRELLLGFMKELASTRVLDPACGSGNFLYVALKALLDLWKEVWLFMGQAGLTWTMAFEDVTPSPAQLHGIELNEYAHELAQVTVWIGFIQWLRDNGFGAPSEPILRPLETIRHMDAILAYDEDGRPVEPEWPVAEVIVGNPPFLGGGHRMRAELGDGIVDVLFDLYSGRVPAFADLVCYWLFKAAAMVRDGHVGRVGLLATNSIRGGANRRVLDQIVSDGAIFMAWSDRPWIQDGTAVRVAMIGFDNGSERSRQLNGLFVTHINADLSSTVDMTLAIRLPENTGLSFQGPSPKGAFDIDDQTARSMLLAPINPNGLSNVEVVRRVANGMDLTRRSRGMWTIDFGLMSLEQAALFEQPFEHVRQHVRPTREANRRASYAAAWWRYAEPRPGMRARLVGLDRFVGTPRISKHRLFVWIDPKTLANDQVIVIARDDDYFFGVLHSRPHELWSLRMCTWLGVGNDPRYTPTTTFETFPFPWPPGHEPADDPHVTAIADAARELVEKRDRWLNPEGASEADLKKRTLTNLYNQRPTWLDLAHKRLDAAVFAAYGWEGDLGDEEVLERLLALNLERARDKLT